MKIVSHDTDFYDYVLSPNQDDKIVYIRNEEYLSGTKYWYKFDELFQVEQFHNPKHPLNKINEVFNTILKYYNLHMISVLLNGKFYLYFNNMDKNDKPILLSDVIQMIKENKNNIHKFSKKSSKNIRIELWDNNVCKYSLTKINDVIQSLNAYEEFLNQNFLKLNEKYYSPILVISNYKGVSKDTNLRNYNFEYILSAEQTNQEISLYFGNKLNKISIVDNDTKIAKHGFDKHSFKGKN